MFDTDDMAMQADAIVGDFAVATRKENVEMVNLNTGKGAVGHGQSR